jgi:hypothetical protein
MAGGLRCGLCKAGPSGRMLKSPVFESIIKHACGEVSYRAARSHLPAAPSCGPVEHDFRLWRPVDTGLPLPSA